jgi:uncharacterized glyoxalase superfamily protein PhnB
MAGGKKKDKKAAKKALKAERKAAKKARKAEKEAARAAGAEKKAARKVAPKPVARAKAARRSSPRKKAAPKVAPMAAARAIVERRQPESLRLRSAGPSFTVNDLQRSLAFYCDLLRFVLKERWEQDGVLRGVELVAGSVSFWLAQDDWKKGRERVKGQGLRIYCSTTQDVDTIADRLRSAGITLLEEPKDQPWGGRDFAVVDPDGFTISIASGGA